MKTQTVNLKKQIALAFVVLGLCFTAKSQNVAINGTGAAADPSAVLDVSSSNQGFLAPRVADTNAVTSPAEGLIIYDLFSHCYRYRTNVGWTDCVGGVHTGTILFLDCAGSSNFGSLYSGTPASGVSTDIGYTGGDGNTYGGQSVASTGVTGLTANLTLGAFNNGSGTISFTITGTPSATGTASFTVTVGGQTCTFSHTVGSTSMLSAGCNIAQTESSYTTNTNSLSGSSKLWITRNLGALAQAASATDAADAAAGCYFQFNRAQAYGNDAADGVATVNPAWTITAISESSNWTLTNDPCRLQLGSTWRLPTSAEWTSADANGSWTTHTPAYASVLKLHDAGFLATSNGTLTSRGSVGDYWSSVENTATNGNYLGFTSGTSAVANLAKATGMPVRCLKDVTTFSIGCNTSQVEADYGTVVTSLSGASKTWITRNLGASTQATSATDASDASAGCYFQFNRQQAYGNDAADGTATVSPAWTITSISETSNWLMANDPCALQLGGTWRIPTATEWTNVDAGPPNWGSHTNAYTSVLKMHDAGYLHPSTGTLTSKGLAGFYWSSVQSAASNGQILRFGGSISEFTSGSKAFGNTLRCLKD